MEAPQNIRPEILSAIRLLSEDINVNMDKAVSIIENTVYNYDLSIYPDFSTGLAGIGYGIQYLICTGLMEAVADEVLEECDQYLFSAVCFCMHTDLTHATGLMGIASYFLGRLEDHDASDDNLSTVRSHILVSEKQLYKAVNDIRNRHAILSYPYDGVCCSLSSDISDKFRDTLDWGALLSEKEKYPTMFGQLTVGGIFVVDRERYMLAGMENEYFIGWGPEDIERLKRLTILNLPVSRVTGRIYHLCHPRKLNSGYVDQFQNLSAKKELLRICRMSKIDLLKEIADWSWICEK